MSAMSVLFLFVEVVLLETSAWVVKPLKPNVMVKATFVGDCTEGT